MADTSVQHLAEAWVVAHGLPFLFPGVSFSGRKVKLSWGGHFAFDGVSADQSIVAAVSTSAAKTATGNLATAKIQKLKTDALYLLHVATPARRLMVFTESCMHAHFKAAAVAGRFPPEVELLHIPLPPELHSKVLASRLVASRETSPKGGQPGAL